MRKDKTVLFFMMICLGLFSVGTVFDETVEMFMVEHGSNVIAAVAAVTGPLPPYVMLSICFAFLAREKKWLEIVALLFSLIFGWCLFHMMLDGIGLIVCAACAGIGEYCLARRIAGKMKNSPENRKKIMAVIVVIACARLTLEAVKVLAGRPRFACLEETGSSFSYWYEFDGPVLLDDRFKSFPSGHAMSASLLYIWTYFGKWKTGKAAAALCFALFVSLGRMMCGMHYLSDVAMGMFIGFASLYLAKNMLE